MQQLTVRDVMTAGPVTVTPATSLKDLAEIMVKQNVDLTYAADDTGAPMVPDVLGY